MTQTRAVQVLAAVFLIKTLVLAFFITPLWDIPDETGHYSYARDIAHGKGLPLLGEAWIDADIMRHVHDEPERAGQRNWIAQHPPVFYLFAAIPLRIAELITDDPEILYRAPRIVAPLAGALAILVLFGTIRAAGVHPFTAAVMAGAIGFIPMYSHLASGTNHDVPLFLLCALASHAWVRFMVHRRVSDAYWCALWLALAASTKMTALVLLAPMLATLIAEIPGGWRRWLSHGAGISLTAVSLPGLWMLRNQILLNDPLATASRIFYREVDHTPLESSFLAYLGEHAVTEHFMLNFFGLFGWVGTGTGNVHWFQVDGSARTLYSLLALLCAGLVTTYILSITFRGIPSTPRPEDRTLMEMAAATVPDRGPRILRPWTWAIAAGVLVIAFFAANHPPRGMSGAFRLLAPALLIGLAVPAIRLLFINTPASQRILPYAILIFVFFAGVVLHQVYGLYLDDGRMRATHGRYFYPVIPLLFTAVAIAADRLRIPRNLLVIGLLLLAYLEFSVYMGQVIPFYSDTGR